MPQGRLSGGNVGRTMSPRSLPPGWPPMELRAIYRCRDRDQAAARLYDWTVTCIDSHVPELRRLARSGRDDRGTPAEAWSGSE